jgi:hypothetical protein
MSIFLSILNFISGLLAAYKEWLAEREKARLAVAQEKRQKREKAVDESKKAESDEDIFKSQQTIVDNKPN